MIKNLTTKKIIAKESKICRNIICKGVGLTFKLKYPKYALIFAFSYERLVPITMWFCFFPIDLVFLDKNFKVVEKKKDLKPWKNYWPTKKAMYVIELKVNNSKNIRIGDILKIN